ncbi:MAG: hypothetical protein KDA75_08415 [Planctomycetaceae bacterium]|nr:hypothetical protein [Planctomycetaceae bacterium]
MRLVEAGDIELPAGVKLPCLLLNNGQSPAATQRESFRTLRALLDGDRTAIVDGEIETKSPASARIHLSHIERIRGVRFDPAVLDIATLQ